MSEIPDFYSHFKEHIAKTCFWALDVYSDPLEELFVRLEMLVAELELDADT